jgi:geranylgeranylglycerol-phosphate geranylgeranyltransferase
MQIARSLLKLTRLDSSVLVALTVFIPLLVRTKDLGLSLSRALPLLFISICTFIANDLDDIEKDRINHPERPLPSGHVKPSLAVVLYFSCLASALFTTRHYVQARTAFWYYLLLTLSISYGYVVDCFPGFKSLYVAGAISVPVLIVATSYPSEGRLYLVAVSVFFFVLGRELCMDFVDRAGDTASFMHRIEARSIAIAAFSSQIIGLLLLAVQAGDLLDVLAVLLMAYLLALSGRHWFKSARYKQAIILMKVQLFVGLYFLIGHQ